MPRAHPQFFAIPARLLIYHTSLDLQRNLSKSVTWNQLSFQSVGRLDGLNQNPSARNSRMVQDFENEPSPSSVRHAGIEDLTNVVRVHRIAFKGFFLDRMGFRFLKAYYQAILDYEAAIFLVNVDQSGMVDGFAVGFRDPEAFYAYFRSRRLHLLPIIGLSLLRRPTLLIDIARNTRRVAAPREHTAGVVELSSIGASRLGTGIGSILLQAFCARSKSLGASEITLTTDRDDNASVLDFYSRHGFEMRETEVRGARVLQVMVFNLRGHD